MKSPTIKNIALLFACINITSSQFAQAKCCGRGDTKEEQKTTVVERIKKKISRMLRNNDVEEVEETVVTECSSVDDQCPLNQDEAEKRDLPETTEIIVENDVTGIETLSTAEVIEIVNAIIAEETEVQKDENNEEDREEDKVRRTL